MKRPAWILALAPVAALALAGGAFGANAANHLAVGPGPTTVIDLPGPDTICPGYVPKTNDDGSYENGYAWAYGGVVQPYYGAWAEGFTADPASNLVCGARFGLTQTGGQDGWHMDVYVWDSGGGNPTNVLSVTLNVLPGTIGMWPTITQHDVDIIDVIATGDYFVGWWPYWVGTANGWYVAADENGFGGGLPRTNIAPGIGFPTGWQHPNVVSTFGGCEDLGIAVYEGIGVPVETRTWGALKALYD